MSSIKRLHVLILFCFQTSPLSTWSNTLNPRSTQPVNLSPFPIDQYLPTPNLVRFLTHSHNRHGWQHRHPRWNTLLHLPGRFRHVPLFPGRTRFMLPAKAADRGGGESIRSCGPGLLVNEQIRMCNHSHSGEILGAYASSFGSVLYTLHSFFPPHYTHIHLTKLINMSPAALTVSASDFFDISRVVKQGRLLDKGVSLRTFP